MKLEDKDYKLIEESLPNRIKRVGDIKLFIKAVLYVGESGLGWSQLPSKYGKWYSIWKRFKSWSDSGIWENIFKELSKNNISNNKILCIDSTFIKVHQDATRYIKKLYERKAYREDQRRK